MRIFKGWFATVATVRFMVSVLVGILIWSSLARAEDDKSDRAAVDAAYDFLYRQMDRLHKNIPVSGTPEYQAYYLSGKIGDSADLSIQAGQCDSPDSRPGCLRIEYSPSQDFSPNHWAGVYFQYPENNWGASPGRNLTGATRISFWAKSDPPMTVKFILGGINRTHPSALPYRDSFKKELPVKLAGEWRFYTISLQDEDLRSVIGPLALVVATDQGGKPGSIFLDAVEIDLSRVNEPRFLQSFVPNECITEAPANVAYVYDQALVLLAFLARGTPEDRQRAELIARAFVQAQNNDRTFTDGRLRNAYADGELLDASTGKARLPGQWDNGAGRFIEDEFAAGSDAGNMAWAALALIQAYQFLSENGQYLDAALRLGNWIVRNNRVETPFGGFRGGYESFEATEATPKGQSPAEWRSTEHNIDLVALFGHLADAVGSDTEAGAWWLEQQAHGRRFVEKMIATPGAKEMYLRTGTVPGSDQYNEAIIPLDTQAWSVLGMGQPERYRPALAWALRHCGEKAVAHAYDFNCNDGDGAWWEGTAQVAAALKVLGREDTARLVLARLKEAQIRRGGDAGAMAAASKCGLTTGLYKLWHADGRVKPWTYPDNAHIGATAWYLFGLLGKNPFYLSR